MSAKVADPLLSVEDIARHWKVSTAAVVPLVVDGSIASLDGGRLVSSTHLDVPCIRLSWAERVRVDSPGAVRRIDTADAGVHPAAAAAYQLHVALQDNDVEAVWNLSSLASRAMTRAPEELLQEWRRHLASALGPDVSLTTGVYRLDPYPGVGVRLIHESAPIPYLVEKPTPVLAAGLIPLVHEEDVWRGDLALARLDVDWAALLRSAP